VRPGRHLLAAALVLADPGTAAPMQRGCAHL